VTAATFGLLNPIIFQLQDLRLPCSGAFHGKSRWDLASNASVNSSALFLKWPGQIPPPAKHGHNFIQTAITGENEFARTWEMH